MCADGCHKDHGVVRVAKRTTCCKVVCRGTSGCRDAYPICLDGGEVLVVAE